ncbi:unnamed protein product [Mytilus coruscus]|uniref:Uncharacterized protein n=1 Tax=Mytilus coruscus TaxID=42192 RepID=A0A6J8AHI9_MYTCO|nr:unnamed protein product [Mytilus coruscus]
MLNAYFRVAGRHIGNEHVTQTQGNVESNFTECIIDCMETEFTRHNAERLPDEWDVPSNRIEIRNHFVTWSYPIQDKSNLTGFKVWFTDWETESCKLLLLNNTPHNLKNFETHLPDNLKNTHQLSVFVYPLVEIGSIKYVQWKGLSFLNVSGNSIKVVFGLQHISSMHFSLYRKNGKLVYSKRVHGSMVEVKRLSKGVYFFQLDDVQKYDFRPLSLLCCVKTKANSRLVVCYRSGSDLHDKVVQRFCDVLKHVWHVDAIEENYIRSNTLLNTNIKDERFNIIVVVGGHGTSQMSKQLSSSGLDDIPLTMLVENWECKPTTLVSYYQTSSYLAKTISTGLQTFDLNEELSKCLDHLYGRKLPLRTSSKLTDDIKCLEKAIDKTLKAYNDGNKYNEVPDNFSQHHFADDDNYSFISHNENIASALLQNSFNNSFTIKFHQSNRSMTSCEHDESITIGGKSV